MVKTNDKTLSAAAGVIQRIVFAVEVVHQCVDDCEVEQIQVEATPIVRLHRTSYLVAVRPVVEPVVRPTDHSIANQMTAGCVSLR